MGIIENGVEKSIFWLYFWVHVHEHNITTMKTTICTLFFAMLFGFANAQSQKDYQVNNATAEVYRTSGLYVFINSTPVKPYTYIGTVKSASIVMSKEFADIMPKMIERTLDRYPTADGIIFKNNNIFECDAFIYK